MKGVTIMTEEGTGKKIAQIDLSRLLKHSNEFEEMFDRLIAEARKEEKDVAWEAVKGDLKRKKKI